MYEYAIGAALALSGFLLGAFKADLYELTTARRLWKAFLVTLVGAGIAISFRFLPLGIDAAPASEIAWRSDVETALAEAKAAGQPAVLDCGAQWCAACKELEHKTFADPEVAQALPGFVAIRLDMTQFDPSQERLAKLGLHVTALPFVGFFLADGRLNPGVTLTDFEAPAQFVRRVKQAQVWREAPLSPVEAWLGDHGLVVALLLVFLAGIGVSLTPCVYPMIPITLSVVGAGGRDPNAKAAPFGTRVARSATFVTGMVATYVVLGVFTAMLGKGFGSWLQNRWVTLGMAALFLALAASYLGFFRLDLPQGLKSRIGGKRGGLLGVAVVGGATGLLAAPCAGPVVVGILAVIGTTGDLLLGTGLMLVFGLGMGLLFFLLGLSTAFVNRIPRGGSWMERVEIVFATALVVVAIYYGRLGIVA